MSLDNQTSPLKQDIDDILKYPTENDYRPSFLYSATLHTVDKDLNYKDGVAFSGIKFYKQFIENTGDYIELQLVVLPGTYVYDIYPQLENIEVTISCIKQMKNGGSENIVTDRYKGVFILDKNSGLPTEMTASKELMNQNLPFVIILQLLDRSVECIRTKTTQGNFDEVINKNKDMSVKSFMKSIVSEECNKILIESVPSIDKVFIEEPDNKDTLKSITIPSGTRVVELPEYIQTNNIGVYNAGIANYIQSYCEDHFTRSKTFFIYSLYNPRRYDDDENKIIFYVPNNNSVSNVDVTYKYKDKILRVVPRAITALKDVKEADMISRGYGFRATNAQSMMKKPVDLKLDSNTKDVKVEFNKQNLNTEVVGADRSDGLNVAYNQGVTANNLELTTENFKKEGKYISIEVSNLDHEFIRPGAYCMINYENKEGGVEVCKGCVHVMVVEYGSMSTNMAQNLTVKYVEVNSSIRLEVYSIVTESSGIDKDRNSPFEGFTNGLDSIKNTFNSLSTNINKVGNDIKGSVVQIGNEVKGIATGISKDVSRVTGEITSIGTNIQKQLTSNVEFKNTVSNPFPDISNNVKGKVNEVVKSIKSLY